MKTRPQRGRVLPVVVSAALSLLGGCGRKPEAGGTPSGRPNVLLITIDALRADHLGCYGYRLPTSPNMDRLAERGVLFTDCTVQWPKTWPSMASLHTGQHPKTTGFQHERRVLPESLLVLSEVFRSRGYRTGAIVTNFNLGTRFGFQQGFDDFVESWQEGWRQARGDLAFRNQPGRVKRFTNATLVTDQALAWLRRLGGGRPFFLWLHYIDPHGPYAPPKEYRRLFREAHPSEPVDLEALPPYQVQKDPRTGIPVTDLGFYRALYDAEIRYVDDEVGRLLAGLEDLGLGRESTLIVLTADHGESLGEQGYYLEHGELPYQSSARVPLIVARDGVVPRGRRIADPVGLIDGSAAIVDLAGFGPPASFEGRSVAAAIMGTRGAPLPRFVFMESGGLTGATQLTLRAGRWKLIHVRDEADRRKMAGTEFELYDLEADPGESLNLGTKRPELVRQLGGVLETWYAGRPSPGDVGREVDLNSLEPEEVELLRSLGYVR